MGKNAILPPKNKTVVPPVPTMVQVGHKLCTGMRGQDGKTNILQCDGDTPEIIIQSKGNIYVDASKAFQISTLFYTQSVLLKSVQFLGSVNRFVYKTSDTLIGGDQKIWINGEETIDVVGKQSINIGGDRDLTVGGMLTTEVEKNQKVTVHGKQITTVDSGIVETTFKSKELTTSKGYTETIGADKTVDVSKVSKEIVKGGLKEISVSGNLTSYTGHGPENNVATFRVKVGGNTITVNNEGFIKIQSDRSKSSSMIVIDGGDIDILGGDVEVKGGEIDISGGNVKVTGESGVNVTGTGGVDVTGAVIKLNA